MENIIAEFERVDTLIEKYQTEKIKRDREILKLEQDLYEQLKNFGKF
jgi:hypothetical protein